VISTQSALHASSASPAIPTIDLARFRHADAAERAAIADRVAQTCRQVGFLVVTGHGMPAELLERVVRQCFAFFDLPDARKNAFHPSGPAKQRGYHGVATRGLGQTLDAQTPPDLRESVFLGPVDDHREHFAQMPQAAMQYAPNILPNEPAGFDRTLVELYRAFEDVARQMFALFAAALRLPPSYFDDLMRRHFSIMGVHHYPPLAAPPLPGQLRCGAHTDYGAMTILAITDGQGGLEARLPDGTWAPMSPRPGELVVNLGDMMARWTNDAWASTLHRVANPPDVRLAMSRRLSLGMFVHPDYDAPIRCIPSCLAAGESPRYAPITAGEHIALKIAKSHQAPMTSPSA
jgi:isopenicillin N synthase-like dioxygenase